jgi:methylated-DNA-[protein]-cysteine S-methyltransferase
MRMITAFQNRIYEALQEVPRGRVTTYALLARRVGCGSPRAVGQALRRNPFAPEVPCHRVIASDLTIGGFQGERAGSSIEKKLKMLAAEGVSFRNGKLSEPARLYSFGGRKTDEVSVGRQA